MNVIQMTAKLYDARDSMRFLFGERYADKVKAEIETLHQLAAKWKCSPVQAIARASKELDKAGDNGVGTAMLLAAYVEDVEGTFEKRSTEQSAKRQE